MNKFLEKDIKLKLGRFEDEELTKEDMEKITELGLNNFTFSNKNKEIDLSELKLFPNLQLLTLQYFKIDDKVIEMLSEFQDLCYIQIASCNYESKNSYNIPNLDNLIINSCKFKKLNGIVVPKNLTINGIFEMVDISTINGVENIENLKLTNIKKVVNFKRVMEMKNLKQLNLDGTKVDDKKALEYIKSKIPVSQEKESLKIR